MLYIRMLSKILDILIINMFLLSLKILKIFELISLCHYGAIKMLLLLNKIFKKDCLNNNL